MLKTVDAYALQNFFSGNVLKQKSARTQSSKALYFSTPF